MPWLPNRLMTSSSQAKSKRPWLRLHAMPRELGHADAGDARFGHELRIDRPTLARPVFGVVGDSQEHDSSRVGGGQDTGIAALRGLTLSREPARGRSESVDTLIRPASRGVSACRARRAGAPGRGAGAAVYAYRHRGDIRNPKCAETPVASDRNRSPMRQAAHPRCDRSRHRHTSRRSISHSSGARCCWKRLPILPGLTWKPVARRCARPASSSAPCARTLEHVLGVDDLPPPQPFCHVGRTHQISLQQSANCLAVGGCGR